MGRKKVRIITREDTSERWLWTYASLITIVLLIFILLYTMANMDVERFEAVMMSLQETIGAGDQPLLEGGRGLVPGVAELPDLKDVTEEQRELQELETQLVEYLQAYGLQDRVTVNMQERGLVVSFMDAAMFASGCDRVLPEYAEIIQRTGAILLQVENYIRVEGHTDNVPIRTARFPTNWELSAARATRVLNILRQDNEIPPERLSASAYGEYRPLRPNDTPENRRFNRRVDLVVLKEAFDYTEPSRKLDQLN